ncbi:pyridoxamine 5'-phosphate oxidase family protein [Streptomyces qinzhouensis]|uniref:TIGR03618 family F420-dependent PPOX class oxidoreductase n=1 Tax=Streptomyces qinzhouensis TaxID=2599401 RepID=A0A5B8J9I0_9ACTN|nr:TIGR03618 family F420-dependent PPOX class oxidoreductase [Streptomyces qinzhouensis]QDY78047.1 TIGR03618 family F420-dependent PPOX class oxidoreductase [Streptomyces qinzhouensis]
MAQGPAPRALPEAALSRLLSDGRFGTLATVKRSGHPHLTTMLFHWDPETRTVRFSTLADRLKATHVRNDPRASVHVQGPDIWSFAVAEGEAEVSAPTTTPGDETGRELLSMLPAEARPSPADETAWFAQQVAERRVVIRLRVTRLYGTALDITG